MEGATRWLLLPARGVRAPRAALPSRMHLSIAPAAAPSSAICLIVSLESGAGVLRP